MASDDAPATGESPEAGPDGPEESVGDAPGPGWAPPNATRADGMADFTTLQQGDCYTGFEPDTVKLTLVDAVRRGCGGRGDEVIETGKIPPAGVQTSYVLPDREDAVQKVLCFAGLPDGPPLERSIVSD